MPFNISPKKTMFYAVLVLVLLAVVVVFCYFFVGKPKQATNITWGVDFSQAQATSLGLDWKQTYSAILEDLGVKNIKLHTQWDMVETQEGNYDFSDIDWQLQQAQTNNAKVIYVVGVKTGRWPECHIPDWASTLSAPQQQTLVLAYLSQVINRYKGNSAVQYWQVENEPFFKFGECPDWYYQSPDFIAKEVALVKQLDPSRQIIISDSGEGSLWFKAANLGDIVGTTMYREVWFHITDTIGFDLHYFFPPVFYERKALLIQKLFGKKVINVELQAEPWASVPFNQVPLAQQYETMNEQMFQSNVSYAKQTGLDTFYFWGVEWWYWLKTAENQPAIWNDAKNMFQNSK
jgi:GH35 family endo-1,4-beta-xylanase